MSVNQIYKYLIETFGHADCKGCLALADLIYLYEPNKFLQDLYFEIANILGSTPSAVERSIRVYLACILKDRSINELGTLLQYSFAKGQTKIKIHEIVPVLKFLLKPEA